MKLPANIKIGLRDFVTLAKYLFPLAASLGELLLVFGAVDATAELETLEHREHTFAEWDSELKRAFNRPQRDDTYESRQGNILKVANLNKQEFVKVLN